MSYLPSIEPEELDDLQREYSAHSGSRQVLRDLPSIEPEGGAGRTVRSTLRLSPNASPVQAVEDVRLGRELGMPPDMVGMDREKAKALARERRIDAQLSDSGRTAEWMAQKPWNTHAALDDVPNLAGTEKVLGTAPKVFADTYAHAQKERALLELADRKGNGDRSPELLERMAAARRELASTRPAPATGAWDTFKENTARFLPVQESILAKTVAWSARGAIGAGMAGAFAGGIGVIPGAIVGAKAGAVAGAASEGFRLERASALLDYEDAGMDSETAWWAATAYGVIAAVIEGGTELVAGIPILFKASPSQTLAVPAKQTAKLTVKKAIFDFAKNLGKMKAGEAVEEGLQQFAQNAVGEAGKALSDIDPDWSLENLGEGVVDSVVQTLWSAIGAEHPTVRLGVDLADVRADRAARQRIAQRDHVLVEIQEGEQAILEQLDGFSRDSQLAKLDPLMYEEALRHLAQGSPVRNIYIPAQGITDAYADNTGKLDDALAALGVRKEDYQLALESGGDLVVPVEKYAVTVAADAEFAARITGHRRLTEDGFTAAELQDWQAAQREEMQRLMASAQEEEQAATQAERESQEIFWAARQMLEAVGQPQDVARANAAQMAAFFSVMSGRGGQYSPRQLWDMYAPDMRRGEDGRIIEASEALAPVGEEANGTPVYRNSSSVLYSPLNPGVNLDAPVAVVAAQPRFAEQDARVLRKRFPKEVRAAILDAFKAGVVNEDTGLAIGMGANDFKEHLKLEDGRYELEHLEAVAALPELMRTARLVESHKDRKPSAGSNLKQVHRFMSALNVGGKDFAVMLTVKEFKDGSASLNMENPVKLYHHRIEKALSSSDTGKTAMPTTTYQKRDVEQSPSGSSVDINAHEYSLRSLLESVNDSEGNAFLSQQKRGSIALNTPSGRPLITLFEQADASTFLHESGHLYLEMLRSLALAENAPPEIVALWAQTRQALGMTDDTITTEQHETWASSLENYFLHGESPSMELRGVFDQFKAWLKAIYNAFRSLGAKPQPELDAVFARLFAADAQIAEVEAWREAQKPLVPGLEEMVKKARESARDARLRRLTRAYLQALGGRKKFVDDARKEAGALPVYAAMQDARKFGMDSAGVEAMFGAETRRLLAQKRLLRKDGESPEMLAARHGYASAEAMLVEMMDAERKSDWIRRTADQAEQLERVRLELGLDAENSVPGDAEYHNDERLALLLAEWQKLHTAGSGRRGRNVTVAAARQAAREVVAGVAVGELNPHRHAVAERRAGKKAAAMAARGDTAAAAQWKQREVLAHALYMETRAAKEAVESGLKAMRDAVKQKSLQPATRELLFDLAVAHGLVRYANQPDAGAGFREYERNLRSGGKKRPDLAEWVRQASEMGYPVDVEIRQDLRPYKDMSFGEFEALRDAFRQIRHIDRQERTIIVDGKRRALEAVRNELVTAARANNTEKKRDYFERNTKAQRVRGTLAHTHATLTKLEMALMQLDGYERGAWWNSIFRPIADAENARNAMLREAREEFRKLAGKLFSGMRDRYDFFNKRIFVREIGSTLSMAQMVSMALNVGNSVNRERLLTGHGWTQAQLDAVLAHLEKRHWDFAQGVWDYLNTFREPSFALHRELSGVDPVAVQPEPVRTKFGEYAGGYYPIVYDKDTSFKAWERAMKDMGDALFGGTSHGTMQTRQEHLKARSKGGTGERLSDDLNVIVKHVFDVAHDVTHRRAVMDVAKLLRDKEIGGALEAYLGPELRREFKPWLQNIARETNEHYIWANSLMRKTRNAVTVFYLGFKVTSMLMQVADLPLALAQKGEGKNTARGLGMLYGNPLKLPERLRFIREKSSFMAGRMENFDREFRDSVHGLRLVEGASTKIKKASMKGIEWMQYALDAPVWLGAYEAELAKTGDEKRAVAVADSTVRLTFGSGSAKDLASIQRGAEWKKLITMFYTAFSAHYNLLARRVNQTRKQGWKGVPGLAAYAFVLWVVCPVVGNLLAGRGPDEDEEWDVWLLNIALREPFAVLPVARDVVGAIGTRFDYEFTPAVNAVRSGVRFGEAVYKAIAEDDYRRLGTRTAEFVGMASGGMITSQHIITIGNVWDYMSGEADDFELRDLLFKKQESRR